MKEGTTTSNFDLHDYDTIKTPNYVGGYRLGTDHYFQFNLTYRFSGQRLS